MIVYSSNESLHLLINNLNARTLPALKEIYSDLNIPLPTLLDENKIDFMSPKIYSLLFRVLYNSTYLERETSERALELLNQVAFREGLVAGIPPGIAVAHKFGIRAVQSADAAKPGTTELHDCGIIYYPGHPYLLCVMTKGSNYRDLLSVIVDVSHRAYVDVDTFFTLPKG